MHRDLYSKLLKWKVASRRKPLILEGARQVGKTWLVREFGRKEYRHLAYFNFEEDPKLKTLFQGRLDPVSLIERLSIYQGFKIDPRDTLLFFDEIQESPEALNSLKYFQEQASHYHLISAGSLLGIKLRKIRSFPVGKVHFFRLHPLSFFEFLDAVEKSALKDLLKKHGNFAAVPEVFHDELNQLLKIYYFTGGMPEAVHVYVTTRDLMPVREIQKEILKSFSLDFSKHAPAADILKISQIWTSLPGQLARENKKFTLTSLHKNARGREYENALQWLLDAGLVHKVHRISVPGLPLEGYREENAFKIYLLDTGLLGAMSDLSPKTVIEGHVLFTHFKGALTENYAAQELVARHEKSLYYWASRGEAEVDFILAHEESVYPLEVKSGSNRRSRSLREYGKRFHPKVLSTTSLGNFCRDAGICHYPLYGVSLFPESA